MAIKSDGSSARSRGDRSWIFVSSVVGGDDTPALAAVDQAARALREADVL